MTRDDKHSRMHCMHVNRINVKVHLVVKGAVADIKADEHPLWTATKNYKMLQKDDQNARWTETKIKNQLQWRGI
jgi:hypothetical protein